MPKKTNPKYRFHKARNCAVVTLRGRDHYLGEYDSLAGNSTIGLWPSTSRLPS
jgi:hypothetical protein